MIFSLQSGCIIKVTAERRTMAGSKKLLLSTVGLLLVAALAVSASVFSILGHTPGVRSLTDNYAPTVSDDMFDELTTQEQHAKKFGKYTHIRKIDGKSVATLYSTAQIYDINTRRDEGEWMYLTDAEMLYLISDTISLFEKYDTVCVVDINGVATAYDATVYNKLNIYYAAIKRIEVLCSAALRIKGDTIDFMFVMNESTIRVSEPYLNDMCRIVRGVYLEGKDFTADWYVGYCEELKRARGSAFLFTDRHIYYVNEISRANRADVIKVF